MAIQTALNTVSSVAQLTPKVPVSEQSGVENYVVPKDQKQTADVSSQNSSVVKVDTDSSVNKKSVDEATKNVSDFVKIVQRDLSFSIEEETGQKIIRVQDKETGELIRQIPAEEVVEMAKRIGDPMGFFVKTEA